VKHLPGLKSLKFVGLSVLALVAVGWLIYQHLRLNDTEKSLNAIKSSQTNFSQNFSDALFEDHLKVTNSMVSDATVAALQKELETLKAKETTDEKTIKDVYDSLLVLEQKINRNVKAGLKSPDLTEQKDSWGNFLIEKDFASIMNGVNEQTSILDKDYSAYLVKLEQTRVAASGYSYQTVQTERGTFGAFVIKVAMNEVKVKTVSAASGTCTNDCDTKSLADYVKDSGGFAGMNGSYFCPPDYSTCGGKVNSSDFALYDSNEGKWEHKDALSWNETGLMTFNGSNPSFYRETSDYGGGGVTAGISNYPSLVKDGDIAVSEDDLTSYQKDVKGPRGVIGVGGSNIYLAIVSNATVIDAAYVIRSLGAKHALNLDGGGSSAMYINGKYVVGPGRSLPNAIVLTK
jgi:exopolysaccharide biosynthesis protein